MSNYICICLSYWFIKIALCKNNYSSEWMYLWHKSVNKCRKIMNYRKKCRKKTLEHSTIPEYISLLVHVQLKTEALRTQSLTQPGSYSQPSDHDSAFHVTETPAVTTVPSVTVFTCMNVHSFDKWMRYFESNQLWTLHNFMHRKLASCTCLYQIPSLPSTTYLYLISWNWLTLKVLNFWKFMYKWSRWISDSYCSLKPLWSGMGEVVLARTSPTLPPPSPPTVL